MAEIAALPTFISARPGQKVLLEGRISDNVPVLDEGYVVLRRRQHQKSGSSWQTLTQPIALVTTGGLVHIVPDGYAPDEWPAKWGHESRVLSNPGWTQGAVTIEGLLPGREVMAVGHVDENGGFVAETISAGHRDHYLEALRERSANERPFGLLSLLIGPLLTLWGAWQIRRIVLMP